MADKPILKIDVDDAAFKDFLKAFNDYTDKLKKQPEQWKRLDAALKKTGLGFISGFKKAGGDMDRMAGNAAALKKHLDGAAKAQRGFTNETKRAGHTMGHLEKTVKGVGRGIASLAKGIGILSGVGVLGGIAGLAFGIPDLAGHVARRGVNARGLGISIGQQSAFETYMRYQLPSASGFLQSMRTAQTSVDKVPQIGALLGMSANAVGDMPVNQLAVKYMSALRHRYANMNVPMWQKWMLSEPYTQGIMDQQSFNTLMRDKHFGKSATQALSASNIHALGWGSSATGAFTALAVQLHKAGAMIESDFVRKLKDLAPVLTRFSNAVAGDVVKFMNSVMTPKNIHSLQKGIGDLAKFLGSKQFHQDLEDFVKAMGKIASFSMWLAHKMGGGNASPANHAKVVTGRYKGQDYEIRNGGIYEVTHTKFGTSRLYDGSVKDHPALADRIRGKTPWIFKGTIDRRTPEQRLLENIHWQLRMLNDSGKRSETPGTVKTQYRNTAGNVASSAYAAGGE